MIVASMLMLTTDAVLLGPSQPSYNFRASTSSQLKIEDRETVEVDGLTILADSSRRFLISGPVQSGFAPRLYGVFRRLLSADTTSYTVLQSRRIANASVSDIDVQDQRVIQSEFKRFLDVSPEQFRKAKIQVDCYGGLTIGKKGQPPVFVSLNSQQARPFDPASFRPAESSYGAGIPDEVAERLSKMTYFVPSGKVTVGDVASFISKAGMLIKCDRRIAPLEVEFETGETPVRLDRFFAGILASYHLYLRPNSTSWIIATSPGDPLKERKKVDQLRTAKLTYELLFPCAKAGIVSPTFFKLIMKGKDHDLQQLTVAERSEITDLIKRNVRDAAELGKIGRLLADNSEKDPVHLTLSITTGINLIYNGSEFSVATDIP